MTMAERIKTLRLKKGLTLKELGERIGVSEQTMWKYESGARPNLKPNIIAKLAVVFDVTPTYLMFGEGFPDVISEASLYYPLEKAISSMPLFGKSIADKPTYIPTRRVPVLGPTAAGEPIIAEREYDEYVEVPADGKRYDAAVRVEGDSMLPLFHIGDLALVRYQPDVEDGEIAVVCIDDTVTLKRVYHVQSGIMLHSENPKYKPLLISEGDCNSIHLTGKVIGQLHWFED